MHRLTLLSLALTVSLACPGQAQSDQPTTSSPQVESGYVEFAQTPYRIESLGMSMWLAVGTQIDSTDVYGRDINFQITSPDSTWVMRGFCPESRDKELTARQIMESLRDGLLKPERMTRQIEQQWNVTRVGVSGELIEESPELMLDGKPAARFYASVARHDGVEMVTGYTVQMLAPGRFMLYEFTSLLTEFPMARGQYETIVAATTFEDPGEAAQVRATGIRNAHTLLTGLTSEDIDSLIGSSGGERFFRLYRPAPSGADMDAEEIAWQKISIWKGQRGEVDPRRNKRTWGVRERQEGWLVQVDGRFVNGEETIETQGFFFLSRDQREELWTITTQLRDRYDRVSTFTELGVRDKDDIKVTVTQPGEQDQLRQWKMPEEAYCSQVLTYLLARIYVDLGAPQVFNVYTYNSSTGELSMRSDSLEPNETGVGWRLRTRQHENSRPEVSVLSDDGELVRKLVDPDMGIMMVPIELETLFDLWRKKQLPLD
ncbi:MAG: hypothetical protein ACF8GE_09960 [Phycisphaerales bacterium JB043]